MLSLNEIKRSAKLFIDNSNIVDGYTHLLIYKKWRCFYSLTGDNAPLNLHDSDDLGVPDYIALMVYKLETAHILLTESFSLKDPLKIGIFADKGVQFFDVFIKNIPREHGIASGLVFDTTYPILEESLYQAKSLKIVVHKNLIARTATPIHELFHVFQYAYCQFNNMWFMEGLARWCQSIVQVGKGKEEFLPQTQDELDVLVHKLHDAEYFWNRLSSLCEKEETFSIPSSLVNNTEVYNNHKTGSQFIHTFLEQCQLQFYDIQKNSLQREVGANDYWPRHEKRTPNNNQAIFRAIIDTVNLLQVQPNTELYSFLDLISPIADINIHSYRQPAIQSLLSVLYKYSNNIVCLHDDGSYYSEFYDIFTQTLTFPTITLSDVTITDKDLASFSCVKRINGDFFIKDCPNISSLVGLNNLVEVKGKVVLNSLGLLQLNDVNSLVQCQTLEVKNMPYLSTINGFNGLTKVNGIVSLLANKNITKITGFNSLQEIYGDLSITENAELLFVAGFNNLESLTAGALKIESNNKLTSLSGFNSLSKIFNTLAIKKCPELTEISALTNLTEVRNIDIVNTSLADLSALTLLFSKQGQFKGYIKIINSRLDNVQFMRGLQSVASSFYLHQNKLQSLQGLECLMTIGGSFSLAANQIKTLVPLANLVEVNGLLSITYNKLTSLVGLEQLQRIETRRWGKNSISFKCYGNPKLIDLSALANIASHDRYLIVYLDASIKYKWPLSNSIFFKNILEIHDNKTKEIIPTYTINKKHHTDYQYFRTTTHNKILTELFDLETNSDTLVLSFTGAYGNLGGLFHNKYGLITEGIDTHKIFIMDPENSWYNSGIQGVTRNLMETLAFLQAIIAQKMYRRIVCMGASMGAYLALIVGNILQVDEVLAFSPQTFLDKGNRAHYGDIRWGALLKKLPKDVPAELLDLNLFFQQHLNTKTQFYLHYGDKLEIDKSHIEHLPEQANIHKVAYPVDDHYITVMLHKKNKLNPIIQRSLRG
mgnify:CR=1 FL=1